MTFAQLSLSGLIDMGFVLLVAASCIVSLRAAGSGEEEEGVSRWREELKELEQVLKGLIAEASAASSQLDRRLLQRKEELEHLLGKLEAGQALLGTEREGAGAARGSLTSAPPPKRSAQERSWVLGDDEIGSLARPETTEQDSLLRAADRLSDHIELTSVAPPAPAAAKPTLQRPAAQKAAASAAARPRPAPAAAPARDSRPFGQSAPQTLASQLEAAEALQDEVERETYEQLSIVDPTAYRIARRLLAAGKEIHVVARKLDLPVSEVRLLDRLMRHERKDFIPVDEPDEPVRHVVRDGSMDRQNAIADAAAEQEFVLAPPAKQKLPSALDSAIERELALL